MILLTEGTRDGRMAGERLLEVARAQAVSPALHVEYDPYDPSRVVPRVFQVQADALLVWGRPDGAVELIEELRRAGMRKPVLVPSLLVLPEVAARGKALGEVLGAASLDLYGANPSLRAFRERYRRRTGKEPSPIAAYAYEAAHLVVAAVDRAGLNRARIRDELARMRYEGVSGEVSFSGLGGYQRAPVLVSLQKGRWVRW